MYESFEHTSDLGLRVKAADLETLFREAAEGLFSLIVEDWQPEIAGRSFDFNLRSDGRDTLFFDWLSELLYTFHTERVLLGGFTVSLERDTLAATAIGTPLDHSAHRLLHEVKAITYHGLKVERRAGGWLAEVIVDI
jgi:SHS2 domain-containing protein